MDKKKLDDLLTWYETLSLQSVADIGRYYAADAHFRDPFNEVRGLAAISRVYQHMFATTEAPRFVMSERLLDGQQAFVTWMFTFGLRGTQYEVAGGTHLRFDDAGLVVLHRDYWDAAEELLQKLPLVGAPVRWLRRLFVIK